MSTWHWSGMAVRLLTVLCVTAGCAAAQQQEDQSDGVDTTTTSTVCKPLPRDCSLLPTGSATGVHEIQSKVASKEKIAFQIETVTKNEAYCDMETDGGGWTVFQRRGDFEPHVDFYHDWYRYKVGFGNLTGEFWWGTEKLSQLVNDGRQYELRINLEEFNGTKTHVVYQKFKLGSECENYALNVSHINVTGDAGDCFHYVYKEYKNKYPWISIDRLPPIDDNQPFSAHDRVSSYLIYQNKAENKTIKENCAERHGAGWWFSGKYFGCSLCNLNGVYLGNGTNETTGINWFPLRKTFDALKKTSMMVRPVTINMS